MSVPPLSTVNLCRLDHTLKPARWDVCSMGCAVLQHPKGLEGTIFQWSIQAKKLKRPQLFMPSFLSPTSWQTLKNRFTLDLSYPIIIAWSKTTQKCLWINLIKKTSPLKIVLETKSKKNKLESRAYFFQWGQRPPWADPWLELSNQRSH